MEINLSLGKILVVLAGAVGTVVAAMIYVRKDKFSIMQESLMKRLEDTEAKVVALTETNERLLREVIELKLAIARVEPTHPVLQVKS